MKVAHILLLLASLATAIGMVFPMCWILSILGLAIFFYLILDRVPSVLQAGWYGLFFGVVTGGAGILWFWDAYPLTFLGITNSTIGLVMVGLTWLYVSVSLGVAVAFFSVGVWYLRTWVWTPLLIPVLWMVTEEARMWGYTFFTYGPGSLIGAHFSPSSIGYVLTENSYLLQLAFPFGLLALNTAAALIAIALVLLYRSTTRVLRSVVFAALLVVLLLPLATTYRDQGEAQTLIRVAVVGTDGPADNPAVGSAQARELLKASAEDHAIELIVLPEVLGFTRMFGNYETGLETIRSWFGRRDVLVASSEKVPAGNGFVEQLVYTSTQSGRVSEYTKMLLVPLGEYTPSFSTVLYALIKDEGVRTYFNNLHSYGLSAGTDVTPVTYNNVTIGGLLCSDLLSPQLYHTLVKRDHSTLLISLSNQYWFHGSHILFDKTLQMARVRAVQGHVPFVLANNAAPSFMLDPTGKVVRQSRWHTPEVLVHEIPIALP
jgi:apolipoprotein N-acyltransferase